MLDLKYPNCDRQHFEKLKLKSREKYGLPKVILFSKERLICAVDQRDDVAGEEGTNTLR